MYFYKNTCIYLKNNNNNKYNLFYTTYFHNFLNTELILKKSLSTDKFVSYTLVSSLYKYCNWPYDSDRLIYQYIINS